MKVNLSLAEFKSAVNIIARVFVSNTLCFYIYEGATNGSKYRRCLRVPVLDTILERYGVDYDDKSSIPRLNCKPIGISAEDIKNGNFQRDLAFEFTDESIKVASSMFNICNLYYNKFNENLYCSQIQSSIAGIIRSKQVKETSNSTNSSKITCVTLYDTDGIDLGLLYIKSVSFMQSTESRPHFFLFISKNDALSMSNRLTNIGTAKFVKDSKVFDYHKVGKEDCKLCMKCVLDIDFKTYKGRFTGCIGVNQSGLISSINKDIVVRDLSKVKFSDAVNIYNNLVRSQSVFKDCKLASEPNYLERWLKGTEFVLCKISGKPFCYFAITNCSFKTRRVYGREYDAVSVKQCSIYVLISDMPALGITDKDLNIVGECELFTDDTYIELTKVHVMDDGWIIRQMISSIKIFLTDNSIIHAEFFLRGNLDEYISVLPSSVSRTLKLPNKQVPYTQVYNIPVSDKELTAEATLYKLYRENKLVTNGDFGVRWENIVVRAEAKNY